MQQEQRQASWSMQHKFHNVIQYDMAYEFACQREPVRFRNEDSFKLMMIALALPQSWTREAVGNELGAYVALRGALHVALVSLEIGLESCY